VKAATLCVPLFLGILATAAISQKVQFKATSKGSQMSGSGSIEQVKGKDGWLSYTFKFSFSVGGHTETFTGMTKVRSDGMPIFNRLTHASGQRLEQIEEYFGAKSLRVTRKIAGKTTVREVAYPKGNLKVKSEFWFVSLVPNVGTKETHLSFDSETMSWERATVMYKGVRTITVLGVKKKTHLVSEPDMDMWLDGKGVPQQILFRGEPEILLTRVR